jgi:glycosyltransferase involved in cell wall biosynthesis
MKVLRIITRLNIGGPAIHTILLSSELNKSGDKDILVCGAVSESEGDMIYLARDKKVEPLVISSMKRDISLVNDLKVFASLFSIMRRERPDIVHTHTAKAGTLGRLAALCAGVPIRVHTFHGHIFDGYFSPLKAKAFLLIERFLALVTDRVITVSESVKDELINKLAVTREDKCAVIPLGLDLDRFLRCENSRGAFRRSIGAGPDTILVGIVGRLVPIKNHVKFLDVAQRVREKRKGPAINFVIVGDGELRSYLERRAQDMGLGDIVRFTGWIEDLPRVYADLDVVALTSLNEGTPVSLIEAQASGRAVIATDVGGVRDLIEDGVTGILVAERDSGSFASKLIGLLEDRSSRERLGANARSSVVKRYKIPLYRSGGPEGR